MPDVWTTNPSKLRWMLSSHEGDIRCGVPPRVVKDRDPQWTCTMDWREPNKSWIGDIYIHDIRDVSPLDLSVILALLLAAFTAGYLYSKQIFSR